ncbi:hypothetical protein [Dactylosporangium sp. NPDC005555]|uniref:hypothetical protein n=1 Tax=Dactylosporangium sp. NPDC005555 TaxID=3154889 RepID=UPI0033B5943F
MARRCAGPATTRLLATTDGLDAAIEALRQTPYGHDARVGQTLAEVQTAVAATLLWHLRVMAGWLPRRGAESLRAFAGWYEISNTDQLLRRLHGRVSAPPFRSGALAVAWPRLAAASTLEEVRVTLAGSGWGDPGAATARAVLLGMRMSWAQRVAAVSSALPWAAGAVALAVAREHWVAGHRVEGPAGTRAATLVGRPAMAAATFDEYVAALPRPASWVLRDVPGPEELWRAEVRWWHRLEHDGRALLRDARFDERAALGAAAVLAVDAWRVRAAMACAAGEARVEMFDSVLPSQSDA